MSILKVKDLTLAYDGIPVVKNLSFSINEEDYLCIVGENGSGKSTLIKSILGLHKQISGSIDFFGAKVKRIGYLPQQTQIQKDFPAKVKEIVLSGFAGVKGNFPFYSRASKKSAEEKMKLLGIEELKNNCYRELSGGQQQRVLLARALCATDSMLLLDEPVTCLDPIATAEMYNIIKVLNQNGITVIMVSHDIKEAVKYADKILHLSHDGSFFGTVEEYLESKIGSNYMKGI